MNNNEMQRFAWSVDLNQAYDLMQVLLDRIESEETAKGNMQQIMMCMTETQFCQMICMDPHVANLVSVEHMRHIYRVINTKYNNQLAVIAERWPEIAQAGAADIPQRLN